MTKGRRKPSFQAVEKAGGFFDSLRARFSMNRALFPLGGSRGAPAMESPSIVVYNISFYLSI